MTSWGETSITRADDRASGEGGASDDNGAARAVVAALGATLTTALAAGATGAMRWVPPWIIPLYVIGVNAGLAVAFRRSAGFRRYVQGLSWRTLALPHALRAPIGAGFLVMMQRGLMPPSLALHAGLGDIAAGVAIVALAAVPMSDDRRHRALRIWNVLGLIDIVTVVMGFERVLLFDRFPPLAARMPWLPFALLPFFVVPWVVASHLALLARASETSAHTDLSRGIA